jgi:hypothetical protein
LRTGADWEDDEMESWVDYEGCWGVGELRGLLRRAEDAAE